MRAITRLQALGDAGEGGLFRIERKALAFGLRKSSRETSHYLSNRSIVSLSHN